MINFIKKIWKIVVIAIMWLLIAYASVLFLGKGNPIEEGSKKVIQMEAGINPDLTI